MVDTEVDFKKLKASMILNGMTQDETIKKSNINRSRYFRIMRGEDDFDRDEIIRISKVLRLNDEEMLTIFFKTKVS